MGPAFAHVPASGTCGTRRKSQTFVAARIRRLAAFRIAAFFSASQVIATSAATFPISSGHPVRRILRGHSVLLPRALLAEDRCRPIFRNTGMFEKELCPKLLAVTCGKTDSSGQSSAVIAEGCVQAAPIRRPTSIRSSNTTWFLQTGTAWSTARTSRELESNYRPNKPFS